MQNQCEKMRKNMQKFYLISPKLHKKFSENP